MASSIACWAAPGGKRLCHRAGLIMPSTEGPSRMPPISCPMTGGWPMRCMSSPKNRPHTSNVMICARKTATDAPCAMCETRSRNGSRQDSRLLESPAGSLSPRPQDDPNAVRGTVVGECESIRGVSHGLSVQLHSADAAADTLGVFHCDPIEGRAVPIAHLEASPGGRNARLQQQSARLQPQAEDPLETRAVHPAGRARV